jgi:hypothetical protein
MMQCPAASAYMPVIGEMAGRCPPDGLALVIENPEDEAGVPLVLRQ